MAIIYTHKRTHFNLNMYFELERERNARFFLFCISISNVDHIPDSKHIPDNVKE